ncbi:MAG TPA: hypothetical protein VFB62_04295 [Polyangiaceae bacterium]|nr:hypothetical protein [Polyangiaceae bacterium]
MQKLVLTLVLLLVLLLGCDDKPAGGNRVSGVPPEGAPTTVEVPSGNVPSGFVPSTPATGEATVRVEASTPKPTPSAAPKPQELLASLERATEVKITRIEGGKDIELKGAERLEPLFEAVDLEQKPEKKCPDGLAAITLTFKDEFETRLGSIGLFKDGDKIKPEAALRDDTGEQCQTIKLLKPERVADWIDQAR